MGRLRAIFSGGFRFLGCNRGSCIKRIAHGNARRPVIQALALPALLALLAHLPDNCSVATIVIRNLDPAVKRRLQVRAALNGRSMEAEARDTLAQSFEDASASGRRRRNGSAAGVRSATAGETGRKNSPVQSKRGSRGSARAVAQKIGLPSGLGTAIHNLFAPLGGVELEIPPRTFSTRPLPKFDE
jgi:plasmid stability protein